MSSPNLDAYARISNLLAESDQFRSHMNSRRIIMEQQVQADEIKSQLCDKLRAEKNKYVGLKDRINALEDIDPKLFEYIRKLEFVQNGIWCSTCNKMKNIGSKPILNVEETDILKENSARGETDSLKESTVHTETYPLKENNARGETDTTPEESTPFKEIIAAMQQECSSVYENFLAKMRTLSARLVSLEEQIHKSVNKKEEPERPNFNIEGLIGRRITADELFYGADPADMLTDPLIGR